MLIDIKKTRIETPDAQLLTHVRFIYKNEIAAIWQDDPDELHSTRLYRIAPAHFSKRRKRSDPHLVTSGDQVFKLWPLQAGGCNCGTPMKLTGHTYDDMLSEGLTAI